MQEETKQNISRLIDGDLGYHETLALLKKMQSDELLKDKMSRYQAISQALKTDEFYRVRSDFSRKVFQGIQREPTHLRSQSRQPKSNKVFAIAASILVVAVLLGQSFRGDQAANNYQSLTAMAVPSQQSPGSFAKPEQSAQRNRQPLNARFNDYLQAHNNSVYTNGEANFQPYAKVTVYGRD